MNFKDKPAGGSTANKQHAQQNAHTASKQGNRNKGIRIARDYRRGATDSLLSKFMDAIHDQKKEGKCAYDLEFELVDVPAQIYNMWYSCVVYVGIHKDLGVCFYYTFILEGSNVSPGRVILDDPTGQVEYIETISSAWSKHLDTIIRGVLKSRYGSVVTSEDKYLCVSGTRIPEEFDVNNEGMIRDVIWNASEAVMCKFEADYGANDQKISVSNLVYDTDDDSSMNRLVANYQFNSVEFVNTVGEPRRSDIFMTLSVQDRNNNNRINSFQHRNNRTIVSASAYMDLKYNPNPPYNMYANQQPFRFDPLMTITGFQDGSYGLTPENMFLAIGNMILLSDNYGWVNAFSNFRSEEVNDIGAIRYLIPELMDAGFAGTKEQSFGVNELFDLARNWISPVPSVAIQCELFGPFSYLTELVSNTLPSFCPDETVRQRRLKQTMGVLDRLTDGHFSKEWSKVPPGTDMFVEWTNEHVGYYTDAQGVAHDLNEISSVPVLNYTGGRDLDIYHQYELTYNTMYNAPLAQLKRRYDILDMITSGRIKVKGEAVLVVLTSSFINALMSSLKMAGLHVDPDGLITTTGGNFQTMQSFISGHVPQPMALGDMMRPHHGGAGGGMLRRNTPSMWG